MEEVEVMVLLNSLESAPLDRCCNNAAVPLLPPEIEKEKVDQLKNIIWEIKILHSFYSPSFLLGSGLSLLLGHQCHGAGNDKKNHGMAFFLLVSFAFIK